MVKKAFIELTSSCQAFAVVGHGISSRKAGAGRDRFSSSYELEKITYRPLAFCLRGRAELASGLLFLPPAGGYGYAHHGAAALSDKSAKNATISGVFDGEMSAEDYRVWLLNRGCTADTALHDVIADLNLDPTACPGRLISIPSNILNITTAGAGPPMRTRRDGWKFSGQK